MKKNISSYLMFILTLIVLSNCSNKKENQTVSKEKQNAVSEQLITNTAALLMGDWNITHINGKPIIQTEQTPYLVFNIPEKRLNGMLGCNRIMGDIILKNSDSKAMSFDKLASTKMYCPNDTLEPQIITELIKVTHFKQIPCKDDQHVCLGLFDSSSMEVLSLQREPLDETLFNKNPQED